MKEKGRKNLLHVSEYNRIYLFIYLAYCSASQLNTKKVESIA